MNLEEIGRKAQEKRFISPFSELCSYYLWKKDDESISDAEIELYWVKLKYMADNVERLI